MKILLVAMSDSIHTARWVNQFADIGWDVRIFPSIDNGKVHPSLSCIPVYHTLRGTCGRWDHKPGRQKHWVFLRVRRFLSRSLFPRLFPRRRVKQLLRVVDEFKPHIVHSLEFQAAGYLTLEAKKERGTEFPIWVVTNWGSDIYYFRQFPEHKQKICEILKLCDFYSCECRRDVCLAEGMGLVGQVLPVIPNTGGFELGKIDLLRQPGLASQRRVIVLKGYQHWVGRALVGLSALESCADLLREYEVVIHSTSQQTYAAAQAFQARTGINVVLLSKGQPHESILALYGRARIALGLSLSDGISTSFLEALAMGAFPIQSWTACADEWIEDGKSGFLVPPEDVSGVAAALRRALIDDDLVDEAARINAMTVQSLEYDVIRTLVIDMYERVYHEINH